MPDATANVITRFLGQDQLTPVVKKVNAEVKGFQKTVGGIGSSVPIFGKLTSAVSGLISPTTLAVGGAALLVSQFVESSKKAAEEQVNIAKLGASLKANVPAWDGNTKAIEGTISARERLAFSDDELRDSLASILPATKNVTKAFEVQRAAMDLARLKGISLQEASTALVRVEAGQYRMLKSLGIVLKEGATATDALAAVQKAAAGQAEAYANTLEGKLKTLDIRFSDMQESVGRITVGPLTQFVSQVDLASQAVAVLSGEVDMSNMSYDDQVALLREMADAYPPLRKQFEAAIDALGRQQAAQARAKESNAQYVEHVKREYAKDLTTPLRAFYKPIWKEFDVAAFKAEQAARELPGELARGILDGTDDVDSAMDTLLDHIKHPPDPQADLQGKLIGKDLAKGLNSSNPYIVAEAKDIRLKILKQLAAAYFFQGGVNAGRTYVRGIASGTSGAFTHHGARARGGPVKKDYAYLVGEQRPEVFVPDRDGTILPDVSKLSGASAPSSGFGVGSTQSNVIAVNVNVNGAMTPATARALGDELGPTIYDYLYRRGALGRA